MYDIQKIYEEHAKTVYKFLLCITNDLELSEDLTQETFFYAIKEIDTFRGQCKISVWLCQIAKYLWYGYLRKEKVKFPIDSLNSVCDVTTNLENDVIDKMLKENVYEQINTLNIDTKKVILFRICGELSFKEIGELMGKSEVWARITFYRGKEKLKEDNCNEHKK